jgi:Family of unknown function (DUF5947)
MRRASDAIDEDALMQGAGLRSSVRGLAHCGLCGIPLSDSHAHLFELDSRALSCACTTCSRLFPGGSRQRCQRVETKVVPLPDLQLTARDWAALDVPERLLFLAPSAQHTCVYAIYPNPHGPVKARLPLRAWHQLVTAHGALASFAYEIEVLLIDGRGDRCACSRMSIDVCHRLVDPLRAPPCSSAPAWERLEQALTELQRGFQA